MVHEAGSKVVPQAVYSQVASIELHSCFIHAQVIHASSLQQSGNIPGVSTNKGRTTNKGLDCFCTEISKNKDKRGNLSYEKSPEFPKYKIQKDILFFILSGWRR